MSKSSANFVSHYSHAPIKHTTINLTPNSTLSHSNTYSRNTIHFPPLTPSLSFHPYIAFSYCPLPAKNASETLQILKRFDVIN